MDDVAIRLRRVQTAIAAVAVEVGRDPADVMLVAVSKTVPADQVRGAYNAGQRVFAENRVQEGVAKIEALAGETPEAAWHLIGHLQTNKVRSAVDSFHLIESVDSLRLADRLEQEASRSGRRVPVLVEVNVAHEPSKGGFDVDVFRGAVPHLLAFPHLVIRGLMTVAPLTPDPEEVRWVFRRLRELRDGVRERFDAPGVTELSMGMSNDFEVAVKEGATMVRLGRAIFGERPVTAG